MSQGRRSQIQVCRTGLRYRVAGNINQVKEVRIHRYRIRYYLSHLSYPRRVLKYKRRQKIFPSSGPKPDGRNAVGID